MNGRAAQADASRSAVFFAFGPQRHDLARRPVGLGVSCAVCCSDCGSLRAVILPDPIGLLRRPWRR